MHEHDQDLLEDRAATLTLSPRTGSRPTSATVAFYKPSSTTAVASGAATLGSWGPLSFGGTPTSQTEFTVTTAANLKVQSDFWLETSDGWSGRVTVSEISGTNVVLESPPPGTLDAAAVLYPLEMTFDLTAANTGERKLNYRSEWTVTCADGTVDRFQLIHAVCRMKFEDAVDATEVKRHLARTFPSIAANEDAGYFEEYASKSNLRVRIAIKDSGIYPHLIGNPNQFQLDAGVAALRLELARDGLTPAGMDPLEYLREAERSFQDSIRSALGALQWIDKDDDAIVEDGEIRKPYSIGARRY